jgi:hypothetical protein
MLRILTPTGRAVACAGHRPAVFHRADLPDVHDAGGRAVRTTGGTDGMRDTHRGGPGPDMAPPPGAPVLLRRTVVSPTVGLLLAELIVTHLLAADAPITVAIDDTLFRRRGKKVHAVGWFHDGSAAGTAKLGFGNNWVVVAIVVTLPFCSRPVALPVLATLAVKGGATKPELARDLRRRDRRTLRRPRYPPRGRFRLRLRCVRWSRRGHNHDHPSPGQIIATRFLPTPPRPATTQEIMESSKPGRKPPHNRESRAITSQQPRVMSTEVRMNGTTR